MNGRMKGKGMRMALWVLGGLALAALAGGVALRMAIAENGPAVLDTVDRIAGGERGAERIALVSTGDHPQQKLVVWGPQQRSRTETALPVLLFVHGGSWRDGDPEDYGFVGRAFVDQGFVVVLAGYRLGEEGRYPAMLEDTASAIAWTHEEIAGYGGDPDRIVIAGHSAGAYNAVMAALEKRWLARHDLSPDVIAGVIGLSGPYDFVPFDSDSTVASFGHVSDPAATQPINHVRPDAPPMLLVHGKQDTLVKPRNTRVLARLINDAGGNALPFFEPRMDHNRPLISLSAPFRGNADMVGLLAGFARAATGSDQTSVPVQAKNR